MSVLESYAQAKSFELDNPEALKLNKTRLGMIIENEWSAQYTTLVMRGDTMQTTRHYVLDYQEDRTMRCGAFDGAWEVIDKRYLTHDFPDPRAIRETKFGGIYSVTALTDSTMILTKLLTSSHDMKKVITFHTQKYSDRLATNSPRNSMPNFTSYYLHEEQRRDSLSMEELFNRMHESSPGTEPSVLPDSVPEKRVHE